MLSAQLVVRGGKHEGKRLVLEKGRFLIGREQDCDLRPSSDLVSRHHCVFHIDDYTVRLRDLGSTNGTLVNGKSLSGEKTLSAGDRVTVGKLTFEVALKEVADEQAAEEQKPPEEMAVPTDGADTSYELPVSPAEADAAEPPAPIPGPNPNDTAMFPVMPGYPPPGYAYPPQYPPQYPGYPPQYPGYPPQYGQYPPQGAPPPGAPQPGQADAKSAAPPVKLPPPPPKRD
ncbi:MAG: FHA domain-containing protein [Planctomycetota bacterium]